MQLRCSVKLMFSPWDPSSLHFIGHCDICGPNIILPTFLAQHSSQDRTTVHSNTHVHICLGFLSDIPVVSSESSSVKNSVKSTGSIFWSNNQAVSKPDYHKRRKTFQQYRKQRLWRATKRHPSVHSNVLEPDQHDGSQSICV